MLISKHYVKTKSLGTSLCSDSRSLHKAAVSGVHFALLLESENGSHWLDYGKSTQTLSFFRCWKHQATEYSYPRHFLSWSFLRWIPPYEKTFTFIKYPCIPNKINHETIEPMGQKVTEAGAETTNFLPNISRSLSQDTKLTVKHGCPGRQYFSQCPLICAEGMWLVLANRKWANVTGVTPGQSS